MSFHLVGDWVPKDKYFVIGGDPSLLIKYYYNSHTGVLKFYWEKDSFIARKFGRKECSAKYCTCGGPCILREQAFAKKIRIIE